MSSEKLCRSSSVFSQQTVPIESKLYLYNLDENEVVRCCALLAYQLRLKHNIMYAFEQNSMNSEQLAQFQRFNHVSCFNEYIELCKDFIACFRTCSDNIATKFSQESTRRQQSGTKRKHQDHSPPLIPDAGMTDDEFRELQSVYGQMQNMRKMFDFYFNIFDGNEFDRYLIYERLYLDTCLSSDVPLTMQLSDFTDLSTLFSSLVRLTLQSTEFANTQFAAFFGPGLLLIMLLYLTSDEVLRDVNMMAGADNAPAELATPPRSHWTRLTILNPADREAICLLRDTTSQAYLRAVATLPRDEFDARLGHVYLSKGDTLATLFLQFNARLFLRLYEWPERDDVKSHLLDKYVCDNIASYFLKSGRSKQHAWIKFFKRKHNTAAGQAAWPCVPINNNENNANSDTTSAFSLLPAQPVETPKNLPQIFIHIPALHGLYDSLARGVAKNSHKRQRTEGPKKNQDEDVLVPYATNAVVSVDGAELKHSWDALESFKQSYVDFFVNGATLRAAFRQWYQEMVKTFILRSGGYRGFCGAHHDITLSFTNDLSVYVANCQACTASLYSDNHTDASRCAFAFEKWAKDIHVLLFPYNFLLISSAFLKNQGVLPDETLRDAWVLKAQEMLVSRRFSADKCIKCYAYLCELEKRARLIIEEGELKHLFMSAMDHLPFIRDLMNIDDDEADDQAKAPRSLASENGINDAMDWS